MKWNLRKRILVPTLALVVVLVLAVGWTAYLMSRQMLRDSSDQQLKQICQSTIAQVESWVQTFQQTIALMAADPLALKPFTGTPAEAEPSLQALCRSYERAETVFGCTEGINLTDAKGLVIASSRKEAIGKINVGDRPYIKEALAGRPAISDVVASRLSGKPIVVLATPVKEGETVRGVVFAALDLTWFSSRFVASIKVLNTGYACLWDARGLVIAHRDTTQILKLNLNESDWGRRMLELRGGQLDYSFQGVTKKASLQTSDLLHWGMAVTVPLSEFNAPLYRLLWTISMIGLCVIAGGIVVMILTARSITRPIQRVTDIIFSGADETTSAAEQVSSAGQTLAEGASTQAASIEEISSSLEEMSSMTQRNAENAVKATTLAKQTREAAEKGSADMEGMSRAMEAIKGSSDDVAKIIKTIDEIAFQTNILALNAAVEAARAGEAGMGFAVVADEVRSLAQRSAQAAKETAAKIEGAIGNTRQGVEISAKVGQALGEIVTRVRQVDELVAEVASASREQSQGINQVNQAVSQMDHVTQANAAGAEESASAAQELTAQAESMRGAVRDLLALVTAGGQESEARGTTAGSVLRKASLTEPSARAASPGNRKPDRLPSPQSAGVSGPREKNRAVVERSTIPMKADSEDGTIHDTTDAN